MRWVSETHGVSRFWELEQDGGQIQDVQGRNLAFSNDVLEAAGPVVECIKGGYKLSHLSLPPSFPKQSHKSTLMNVDFVEGSIKEL